MASTAKPLGNMIINLDLNDLKFKSGLEKNKRAVRYWMSEMKSSMKVMNASGDKLGALKARYNGLTKVIEDQKKVVTQAKKDFDEYAATKENDGVKTTKLATEYQMAVAKLAGFETQLKSIDKELKINQSSLINTGKHVEVFGSKLKKQGKIISSFGSTVTKAFTLPVGLLMGGAVKAAMDFEDAFSGVRKTVNASEKEFKVLSDGFKEMSKEIPVSASELSRLGEIAGQLGVSTPNIKNFVRVIADLGVATNLSGEEGAQMLAKFANITKMPQSDYSKLGSTIVDLGNNFSTTENDIMQMAMRLAGAGHQIGLSQSDILGISTALSSVGVEAEMGGSAFSKVMTSMKVATATGLSQMKKLEQQTGLSRRELELLQNHDGTSFKELAINLGMTTTEMTKIMRAGKDLEGFASIAGMTGEQFKQAFEKDAVGAIGAFINGLGTAEEKGTSAIELLDEMGISETRLRDSLVRAGNAQELFGKATETASGAWDKNIALTKEAETKYGTFASQLDIFKNKLDVLGIDFGGPIMAAANSVLDALNPLLEKLSELSAKFVELPKEQQETILKFIALGLSIGPIAWGIGKVVGGFGSLFNTLGSGMQKFGKFRIESDLLTQTLPSVSGGIKKLGGNIFNFLVLPFKTLKNVMFHPINSFKTLISSITTGIGALKGVFGGLTLFLKKGMLSIGSNLIFLFENGLSIKGIFSSLVGVFGSFSSVLSILTNPITLIVAGIAALAGGILYLNGETGSLTETFKFLKETVLNFFSVVYTEYIKPAFDSIVEAFQNVVATIKQFWSENGEQIVEGLKNFFMIVMAVIQPALTFWKEIFSSVFRTIVDLIKIAWDTIKGIFSGAFQIIGGFIKVFAGLMTGDFKKAGEGVKDIFKGMFKIVESGFKGFSKAIGRIVTGIGDLIASGIGGAINGVIKGINWVLKMLGADPIKELDWGKKDKKKPKKHATGTNSHPGGDMIVNDQAGSTFKEFVQFPNGRTILPEGRNVFIPNAPKGTKVMKASESKNFIPHYKNGVGDFFGKAWGKVKDFTGDVWDYMKDPGKLVEIAMDKFASVGTNIQPWLDMGLGSIKFLAKKSVGFVKSKMDEFHSSGFDGDDSKDSNGVYSYLMNIARGLMKKHGMIFTSGFRAGDPYDHGKGLAVDIALPGVTNGSSIYKKAADEAINMAGVKYVITNGMWKHKGKSWVPWADGDHYDHVHISGEKPTGKPKGDIGGGVEQWRSTVIKALKMTGQYSAANVNRTLYQMKTESGGNPRAINNWDSNAMRGTPSKGLMQVIDPTFQSNKMKGFNNIWAPLDNILASIRYAVKNYGSLASAYRGVGYENGGIITRQHLAMVGEGNKPEMIIPLTDKSRAYQLMEQAKSMLGIEDSPNLSLNNNRNLEIIVEKLAGTVEKQGQMMLALLKIIANKELNIDFNSFSKMLNNKQGSDISKLLYMLGGD